MRNDISLSARVKKSLPLSECGDTEKILYSTTINPDGTLSLKESGRINIQALIQSEADLCDISVLIARYLNGDLTALNQRTDGMYGDFTNCPKSYAEMLQNLIDAQDSWDNLPLDTRKAFDNNFNLWLSSAGSTGWIDKMTVKPDVFKDGIDVSRETMTESEVIE